MEDKKDQTDNSTSPVDTMPKVTGIGGIFFFAVSTQDAQFAARVLSVITTAQVAGRTLTILYDPADLSGAAIGCQNNDCRLIRAVGFGQ